MIPIITTIVPAVPCTDCGRRDGFSYSYGRRPSRMSGKRFGIDGPLCSACYYRERYRQVVRPRKLAQGEARL